MDETTLEGSASAEPSSGRGRIRVASGCLGVGAAVLLGGAFLPWATITLDLTSLGGDRTTDVAYGFESTDGLILVGIAVVLLLLVLPVVRASRLAALGALLGGAVAVATVGIDMVSLEEDVVSALAEDLSTDADIGLSEARDTLAGRVFVTDGAGLYAALGGGWLAAIGGVVGGLPRRRRAADLGEPSGGLLGPGSDGPPPGPTGEAEHPG